jgi:hypothetical protein
MLHENVTSMTASGPGTTCRGMILYEDVLYRSLIRAFSQAGLDRNKHIRGSWPLSSIVGLQPYVEVVESSSWAAQRQVSRGSVMTRARPSSSPASGPSNLGPWRLGTAAHNAMRHGSSQMANARRCFSHPVRASTAGVGQPTSSLQSKPNGVSSGSSRPRELAQTGDHSVDSLATAAEIA